MIYDEVHKMKQKNRYIILYIYIHRFNASNQYQPAVRLYLDNFKETKVNYFLNIINLFPKLSYEIPEASIYIENS